MKPWSKTLRSKAAFALGKEAFEFIYGASGVAVMFQTVDEYNRNELDILQGVNSGLKDAAQVQAGAPDFEPHGFFWLNHHMVKCEQRPVQISE